MRAKGTLSAGELSIAGPLAAHYFILDNTASQKAQLQTGQLNAH
jgi:hypothetical protein